MEYDPRTCITAGELRAAGIEVDEKIPDVGWIPRVALELGTTKVDMDGDTIVCSATMNVTEPFRWITLDAVIK